MTPMWQLYVGRWHLGHVLDMVALALRGIDDQFRCRLAWEMGANTVQR